MKHLAFVVLALIFMVTDGISICSAQEIDIKADTTLTAPKAQAFSVCEGAKLIEKWGAFDHWVVREIKESLIIGGETRYTYEVAPGDTIKGNIPYQNPY